MKNVSEAALTAWKKYIRYRRIATALLLFMGILTLIGYIFAYYKIFQNNIFIDMMRAGAQAGFIGGIADWFAVTALFRHPLGLPIPHTAILPQQQKRIAIGLGAFVAHRVFTKEDIENRLKNIDIPSLLATYISDTTRREKIANIVLNTVPSFLDRCEDGRINILLNKAVSRLLSGESIAPLITKILKTMVGNEYYQDVVSFLLEILKHSLKEQEEKLRVVIQNRVREQGGRFIGWMIGSSISTKVLSAINKEMDRIDPHDSDLRDTITTWIEKEIISIENTPEKREKIAESLRKFMEHEAVKEWREDLWYKFRLLLEEDAKKKDGWMKALIDDSITYLSTQLQEDVALRQKLMNGVEQVILNSLPKSQEWLTQFIEHVVNNWDGRSLVANLEHKIGKDLQYIRINGSLVGFFVGVLLYLFAHICFGYVV